MYRKHLLIPLFVLSIIVALVLAACGGGEVQPTATPARTPATPAATPGPTPTPTPVPPTPTPAPKRGGVLRSAATTNLSPRIYDVPSVISSTGLFTFAPVLNTLVQFDAYDPSKLVGDLAERWSFSSDGLTITLELRKDVFWQDGTKFTSADAAWSIERIVNPPQGATVSDLRDTITTISKIETPDDSTLRLTLKHLSASLFPNLANPRLLVYPKHLGIQGFTKTPIGTGPFKFSKFENNVSIELTRNEKFWKPGLPYLDGVTYFIIPDFAASLAAFRAGRLDLMDRSSNALVGKVNDIKKELPNIQIDSHTAGLRMLFIANREPYNDPRVRKAIHLAINREQIIAVADVNDGVANVGPMIPESLGGIFGLPESEIARLPGYRLPKDQDIAEAKRLLEQAGVKPGTLKPNYLGEVQRSEAWMQVVAENLKVVGIEPQLKILDRGVYIDSLNKGNFDLGHVGALPQLDDPSQAIAIFWTTGGARNYAKYSNPEVDDLYARQDRTLDQAERKRLVLQLQRVILDWNVIPLLGWGTRPIANYTYVKNLPDMAMFWSNAYRMDQVWLDR